MYHTNSIDNIKRATHIAAEKTSFLPKLFSLNAPTISKQQQQSLYIPQNNMQELSSWMDGEWIGDFSGPNLTYGHFFQHLFFSNQKRHQVLDWNFGHCPIVPDETTSSSTENLTSTTVAEMDEFDSSNLLQTSSFTSLNVINQSTLIVDYLLSGSGRVSQHQHRDSHTWKVGKIILSNVTSVVEEYSKTRSTPGYISPMQSMIDSALVEMDNDDFFLRYIFFGDLDYFVTNTSEREGERVDELTHLFKIESVCLYFNQEQWLENFYIPAYGPSDANLVLSLQINPKLNCLDVLRRKAFCNETSHVFVFESPGKWTGFLLLLVVLGGITMVFSVVGGIGLVALGIGWFFYRGAKRIERRRKAQQNLTDRHTTQSSTNHLMSGRGAMDDFVSRRRLLHGDLDVDDAPIDEDEEEPISAAPNSPTNETMARVDSSEAPPLNSRVTMVTPSPVISTAQAAHLLGITGRKHFRFFQ